MSKVRKDSKGRLLRRGESYKKSKKLYQFVYTDIYGKRVYIYAKDLFSLREKEKEEQFNEAQGIDTYVAGTATLDILFHRFIVIKRNLHGTTISN
ncbi:MAG: integrase DNA-binding domain-containing protein [Lachnospiraceae bacterium]|nr:integrase DNA-binding domain-containing protein [Lachnospiraceae bacterium]